MSEFPCASASHVVNKRLSGRFLFVPTNLPTNKIDWSLVGSSICLHYMDLARLVAVVWSQRHPPLVDFSPPRPHRTPTPVNRRLRCADLCTVFCSNDAVRASPLVVNFGRKLFSRDRRHTPLCFLFKKGEGIYFLKLTVFAHCSGIKKPPEGG